MSMCEDSKQKAWLEHYQRLLNVEFDWDPDYLSDEASRSDRSFFGGALVLLLHQQY